MYISYHTYTCTNVQAPTGSLGEIVHLNHFEYATWMWKHPNHLTVNTILYYQNHNSILNNVVRYWDNLTIELVSDNASLLFFLSFYDYNDT